MQWSRDVYIRCARQAIESRVGTGALQGFEAYSSAAQEHIKRRDEATDTSATMSSNEVKTHTAFLSKSSWEESKGEEKKSRILEG